MMNFEKRSYRSDPHWDRSDRAEICILLSGRCHACSGFLFRERVAFVREIDSIVAPDGVWHFEQSYMPSMLRMTSYDTICHGHLEFYSLSVIKKSSTWPISRSSMYR